MLSQSRSSANLRRWAIGYVVLVVGAFLWIAQSSNAAETTYIFPRAHFILKGTHGYTATVDGWPGKVRLTLTRGLASVEYEGPAKFRNGTLDAKFSTYGEISVAFKPSGVVHRVNPPPHCRGTVAQEKSGVFIGRIAMRGAQGFSVLSSRKAHGGVLSGRWRCRTQSALIPALPPQRNGKLVMLTSFHADDHSGRRFGVLAPATDPFPELSVFFAEMVRYEQPLRIRHFAMAFGGVSDFSFEPDLSSAIVAPPPPFHGTVTFGRNSDGLFAASEYIRVDFPGVESVQMAGPESLAELKYVKLPPMVR